MKKKPTIILPDPSKEVVVTRCTPASNDKYDHSFRVMFLGDAGSGCSSTIIRITHNYFPEHFISSIGVESKVLMTQVGDEIIKLELYDTPQNTAFDRIQKMVSSNMQAFIVFFDITEPASFHNLKMYINEIRRQKSTVPIIIAANKYDLPDRQAVDNQAIIDYTNSLELEQEVTVIGISAKTGLNIDELVTRTAEVVYRTYTDSLDTTSITSPKKIKSPKKLQYKKQIDADWRKAKGNSSLEKALTVLNKFTAGDSKVRRALAGHPWRHGVYEVQAIISAHKNRPIASEDELITQLEEIQNLPAETYLSDFICYLKDKMYLQLDAAPKSGANFRRK